MAKIYSTPDEVEVPVLNISDVKGYFEACDKYKADLKAWLIKRNNAENVGDIIRFLVGDGYAEYMVAAMKPLQLVHLPLGDGWVYEFDSRLTAKDVKAKIAQEKSLSELFSKKK